MPPSAPSPRRHVLVVEDNPDTRYLLEALLGETYNITLAANGSAALSLARETSFDLVLMDINLGGGMTGVETLAALRDFDAHDRTPVVALTAYAMPGDRENFLDAGFTAYLAKPFEADELLSLIADLTDGCPA